MKDALAMWGKGGCREDIEEVAVMMVVQIRVVEVETEKLWLLAVLF